MKSNVVLIGMPGAGKSTIGVILAKTLGLSFVDTDILIQESEGRTLQAIIDAEGHERLRDIEAQVISGHHCRNHVIATGGSAVYSPEAMASLAKDGVIVYLETNLPELERRIGNFATRGIAKRPDQSFQELFDERSILYNQYADVRISTTAHSQDQLANEITQLLAKHNA